MAVEQRLAAAWLIVRGYAERPVINGQAEHLAGCLEGSVQTYAVAAGVSVQSVRDRLAVEARRHRK